MKKSPLMLIIFITCQITLFGQDTPLILDHPSIFKLIDWGVYTHYNCGFTKVETTANYQKIIGIPLWVVFGPYPGKITDVVLQHKESKVITNLNGEKSTVTIDFRLSRKDN